MKRTFFTLVGIAALTFLAVGCGEESGTNPVPEVTLGLTVSFDLTTPNSTRPGGDDVQASTDPDLDGPPDSVTVSSGLFMIRSVRLNSDPIAEVDTIITAADEDRDISDASVRFHGPYVIDVDGSALNLGSTSVSVGDYRQLTFVLQKARTSDDLDGHDELTGSSIRVTGKVWRNNVAESFVYTTDHTSEFAVNGDFSINESMDGSIGLEFGVGQWFHNGNRWLDPEEPSNHLQILNSVRRNISATIQVLN